jgi:hypothetical protein
MTLTDITQDARPELLAAGLLLSVLALAWIVRRVRQVAKSDRPDEPLSNLAMVIGLGWSSEAVWVLTGRAGFPVSLRLLLFFVLESLLVLAMIRAKRTMKEHGHPGRSGRTAWIVATAMAVVAAGISTSIAEGILRLLIPLLVTLAWWDGLIGETGKKAEGASSWRWTPRRLLLWLGAIEPGERDIETVHRERLTQQMTRLEFRRRHGSGRQQRVAAGKLARLSLAADDAVVAEVRTRVDRAGWFTVTPEPEPVIATVQAGPMRRAAEVKDARRRRTRLARTLRVTRHRTVVVADQDVPRDQRTTQEVDDIVVALRTTFPKISMRQIAVLARVSDSTVRRSLRRTQNPAPPPAVNGREPELTQALP